MVKIVVYESEFEVLNRSPLCNAELPYFFDNYGLMRVRYFGKDNLVKRINWNSLLLEPLVRDGDPISVHRLYYIVKDNNGA
jgi:hypothetical protein